MEIKFTAKMEQELDQVAEAKLSYKKVISDFGKILFDQLAKIKQPIIFNNIGKDTGAICPVCKEGNMLEKNGKSGPFYSCNRYPQCRFTLSGEFLEQKITHEMIKKLCEPGGKTETITLKKIGGGTYEGILFLKDNKLEFQFQFSNRIIN